MTPGSLSAHEADYSTALSGETSAEPWNYTCPRFRVWYPEWNRAKVCAIPTSPAMATGKTMWCV